MEAYPIPIHAVEMLDYWKCINQVAGAIRTKIVEPLSNKMLVFFSVYFNWPIFADLAAQFVKKHTDQLVRNV